MNILLTNTYYQSKVEFASLLSVIPPLDLAYAAALVRQEIPDSTLHLVDANALRLNIQSHVEAIHTVSPEVIIITAATYAINTVKLLAKHCTARLILIGTHGSVFPVETMNEIPSLEVVVRGEPEYTLVNVIKAMQQNTSFDHINNIAYRKGTHIICTNVTPQPLDLDTLPFPARDLLPNHLYSSPYASRITAIQATRGCPGQCTFCDSHIVYGRSTRTRSVSRLIEEMNYCKKTWGIRYFAFTDHTFTADQAYTARVCEALIQERALRGITWVCNTRVDVLTPELLKRMKKAGCIQIGIGIESARSAHLVRIKKHISCEQITSSIDAMRSCGIIAMGYSIIGFPDQTKDDIEETGRILNTLNPHIIQLSFATPLPGTALYDQACREHRLLSTNWDDYLFLKQSILRNDFLSPDEVRCLHRHIVRSFYLRPGKLIEIAWLFLVVRRLDIRCVLNTALKVLKAITSR